VGAGGRPRGFTNGDPPSPTALRELLQALPVQTPGGAREEEHELAELAPSHDDGELGRGAKAEMNHELERDATGPSRTPTPPLPVRMSSGGATVAPKGAEPGDQALRETIRGLFLLWKSGRQQRGHADELHEKTFLELVRDAVGAP
jgi:hypothetical protein